MKILGIETSCDETAVAIYNSLNKKICFHKTYSHIHLHKNYGGVIPELSSREHIKRLIPLIQDSLKNNNTIDVIAYTNGPGLIGCLFVGATIANALAYSWNIPAIPIHHMEGHLLTPMLENHSLKFPFLSLLISGGNTQLVSALSLGKYFILGKSLDNTVGETIDKIAFLLGLKYPGGFALEELAKLGNPDFFKFPRPMINKSEMNFSFSGLKTHVTRIIQKNLSNRNIKADIASSFQNAIIDTLTIKTEIALKHTGHKKLVVAGGVSANLKLRSKLSYMAKKNECKIFYASPKLCTDNAIMIAYAGFLNLKNYKKNNLSIKVKPKWSLESLYK